jgi:Pyridoxamine 5'-phosphate oxidase
LTDPSLVESMVNPPARPPTQRKRDALARLEHDVDLWVATADPELGAPYLTPLSFLWDGETILIATTGSSPTGRNLQATAEVRLGVGLTRDVVLIEGTVDTLTTAELPDELGDAFAAKAGFDPRRPNSPYLYFRIHPQRVLAWREENELADRELMHDGRWLVE